MERESTDFNNRELFGVIYSAKVQKEAVWAKFAHTAADGKVYSVDYYNLDAIISVGYRVKSQRGVQFRIWATGILKEYMRPVLIMIPMRRYPFGFLRKSKTRFIMPFMDKQWRRSF